MNGIIKPDGCKNCKHGQRAQLKGKVECHFNPPIPHPLFVPAGNPPVNDKGEQIGPTPFRIQLIVTMFPQCEPDWMCSHHIRGVLLLPHDTPSQPPMKLPGVGG